MGSIYKDTVKAYITFVQDFQSHICIVPEFHIGKFHIACADFYICQCIIFKYRISEPDISIEVHICGSCEFAFIGNISFSILNCFSAEDHICGSVFFWRCHFHRFFRVTISGGSFTFAQKNKQVGNDFDCFLITFYLNSSVLRTGDLNDHFSALNFAQNEVCVIFKISIDSCCICCQAGQITIRINGAVICHNINCFIISVWQWVFHCVIQNRKKFLFSVA